MPRHRSKSGRRGSKKRSRSPRRRHSASPRRFAMRLPWTGFLERRRARRAAAASAKAASMVPAYVPVVPVAPMPLRKSPRKGRRVSAKRVKKHKSPHRKRKWFFGLF